MGDGPDYHVHAGRCKNAAALPAGVTFDAAGKRFVYSGAGAAASTTGHVLTADDGKP